MATNFETNYSDAALAYVKEHTDGINTVANLLGISALGVAGSIAREITANDKIYTSFGSNWIFGLDNFGRDELVQLFSHETLAADYIPSLSADVSRDGVPGALNKLVLNPDINDIGPGRIRISTAIFELLRYQVIYPDSDPLDLKKYSNHYDTLVHDLLDPDSDATIKIAGLVIQEAEAYLKAQGAGNDSGQTYDNPSFDPSIGAASQWNQYSDGERAALDVKAYSVGFKTVEAASKVYLQYNIAGSGSDIFFYDMNLNDLYNALGQNPHAPNSLELEIQPPSADGSEQYLKIDYLSVPSNPDTKNFELRSYLVDGQPIAYITNPDVGEVRLDTFAKLTLSSGDDTLTTVPTFDWTSLAGKMIDGGAGNDTIKILGGGNSVAPQSQVVTIAGGLGRDLLYNNTQGGVIWGDVADSILDKTTDQRYYLTTNADGTTKKNWIADDASNADNFQWSPGATVMDPQKHDILTFYGVPLVGGGDNGGVELRLHRRHDGPDLRHDLPDRSDGHDLPGPNRRTGLDQRLGDRRQRLRPRHQSRHRDGQRLRSGRSGGHQSRGLGGMALFIRSEVIWGGMR